MVWGGFGYGSNDNMAFLSDGIKATHYQEMLENHLLPFTKRIVGLSSIFQQDKTFINAAKSS